MLKLFHKKNISSKYSITTQVLENPPSIEQSIEHISELDKKDRVSLFMKENIQKV
jgi:hypothetical protein